jgi:hypothetical protein
VRDLQSYEDDEQMMILARRRNNMNSYIGKSRNERSETIGCTIITAVAYLMLFGIIVVILAAS